MRKLIVLPIRSGHASVAEARGLRHCSNTWLLPGQEVPAGRALRVAVVPDVFALLRGRNRRRLRWIDRDRHELEVLARLIADHLERAGQPFQLFRAQDRTLVIHQRQQHRMLAVEVLAQLHRLAAVVHESRVQRQLLIQVLLNGHAVQHGRQLAIGRIAHLLLAGGRHLRVRNSEGSQQQHAGSRNRAQAEETPAARCVLFGWLRATSSLLVSPGYGCGGASFACSPGLPSLRWSCCRDCSTSSRCSYPVRAKPLVRGAVTSG